MAENKCTAVWFNPEAIELHQELLKKKLTSQVFKDFVKDSFHDKVDDIRASRGNNKEGDSSAGSIEQES